MPDAAAGRINFMVKGQGCRTMATAGCINSVKLHISARGWRDSCPRRASASPSTQCVLDGLKYTSSHEWVKNDGAVATIGISDHAQVSTLLITSYSFEKPHLSFPTARGSLRSSIFSRREP
ncbi:hypothetical protein ACQ4PT_006452 [Festuca glaucescens]